MSNLHPLHNYSVEKISQAIGILISGKYDVRSRLYEAAPYLMRVNPLSLPVKDGIRSDMEWIHQQLTRYPKERERDSKISATLRKIRMATGAKIASRIESMFHKLLYLERQK